MLQAFHDHTTGTVLNGDNWTPTLLQGAFNTITPGNTDCFMYEESWGMQSFLLDDDGCVRKNRTHALSDRFPVGPPLSAPRN